MNMNMNMNMNHNKNNRFNCFEEEHANSVDTPKTTSNPLRKKKKQLRKFESKYKSNPTPELSCSIDKLKEEIDKMQNPDKYKYTREPKFKKRKFDKSDKYVKKKTREYIKTQIFNTAKIEKERIEMERKTKERLERKRQRALENERRRAWEKERMRWENNEEAFEILGLNIMDCPSDIESFARTKDPEVRKRNYRKLSLKYHPDKGGDDKWMKIINNLNECV